MSECDGIKDFFLQSWFLKNTLVHLTALLPKKCCYLDCAFWYNSILEIFFPPVIMTIRNIPQK